MDDLAPSPNGPAPEPHRRRHDREIVRLAGPALGALATEPLYVLVDTAIVLGQAARSGGRLTVVSQFAQPGGPDQYGAIIPKGSKNSGAINAVLKQLSRTPPRSVDELVQLGDLLPWQAERFAQGMLDVLTRRR